MKTADRRDGALARNVRRLGHIDLPGAGQVTIAGNYAYVGHIPNKQNLGTSIVDISDPKNPRLVTIVTLDDPASHSHKVRVAGDLMVVNHERNPTPVGRRAEQLPGARRELQDVLGRGPSRAELAQKLGGESFRLRRNRRWPFNREQRHLQLFRQREQYIARRHKAQIHQNLAQLIAALALQLERAAQVFAGDQMFLD